MPCCCAVAIACSPSSRARSGSHAVSTVAQSYCTSAVHSGDALRSARSRATRKCSSDSCARPRSAASPPRRRSAGPKQIVIPAIRLWPRNGISSSYKHAGVRPVAEGDARLGEERQRRRPHRVPRHGGEAVGRQPLEHHCGVVEHAEVGVQRGQTRTPRRRWVGSRGEGAHHRRDLGEATLGAPDRVHLQSVHALVVRRAVGGGARLGLFGGGLGGPEVSIGEREDGLVGVGHELERGEAPSRARHPVTFQGLGGLPESPEGDARPELVGRRVGSAPRIAESDRQLGELGAGRELPSRIVRRGDHRLEGDHQALRVTDGAGEGDRGLRRRQPLHRVPGEHQGPPERGRGPGPNRRCVVADHLQGPPEHLHGRPAGQTGEVHRHLEAHGGVRRHRAGAELGGDLERLEARLPARLVRRSPQLDGAHLDEHFGALDGPATSGRARRRGGRPPRRTPPPASPGRPPGGRSTPPCRAGRSAWRRRSGGPGRPGQGDGRPRRRPRSRGPGRDAGAPAGGRRSPTSTVSRTMECSNRWISASPAMPASSPAATSSRDRGIELVRGQSGRRLEGAQVDPLTTERGQVDDPPGRWRQAGETDTDHVPHAVGDNRRRCSATHHPRPATVAADHRPTR